MQVIFNGEKIDIPDSISLLQCLELQNVDSTAVVVELNMNIILSAKYATTILQKEDVLEVLHFVGGG